MKFDYGEVVQYHHIKGWVNFICDEYITICFIDRPDKQKRNGRYQANLIVFREYWNEVCRCVDERQEEQADETTSYFLQSRGCDSVGTTHQQD
jgi:hypothetical protein